VLAVNPPGPAAHAVIVFESPEVALKGEESMKPDVNPGYPGGESELIRFLQENIRYPLKARTDRVQGTVFVNYVVEENGEISDVSILRSVSPELDEEAMRVVKMMPAWTPGQKDGESISVKYSMGIRFVL
jgi:periplasmic protein TonB